MQTGDQTKDEQDAGAKCVSRKECVPKDAPQGVEARNQIVVDHLSLVKAIAIRVHETLPVHVDLDDLVHAGVLGPMDAVEKFDASKTWLFKPTPKSNQGRHPGTACANWTGHRAICASGRNVRMELPATYR